MPTKECEGITTSGPWLRYALNTHIPLLPPIFGHLQYANMQERSTGCRGQVDYYDWTRTLCVYRLMSCA